MSNEIVAKIFIANNALQMLNEAAMKLFPGRTFSFTMKFLPRSKEYQISLSRDTVDRSDAMIFISALGASFEKASSNLIHSFYHKIDLLKKEEQNQMEKTISRCKEELARFDQVLSEVQEQEIKILEDNS